MFSGTLSLPAQVPSGPVHEDGGVGLSRNRLADLVEMQLHGLRVGPWQHERCALALFRADGAEQIRVLIALVGGLTGACAFPRPQAGPSVLLAKPGLILKPDLDWRTGRQVGYMRLKGAFEVFLNASMIRSSCLGCCGRALM